MSKCTIIIDGTEYQAEEGANLVDAARELGIFIPSLCHYSHIDPPLGTCRTCTCKMNGRYDPACTAVVKEGLTVEVNTEELTDIRKALLEMMFAEGNHFCPACEKSGNCDLQHMGYELGISTSRFPHLFQDRHIDFSPKRLVLEQNRCVKCKRCVVDVLTSEGKKVFHAQSRGNQTVIAIDKEAESNLSEEEAARAMTICPTGAILLRGKSLSSPFGTRLYDRESSQVRYAPDMPGKTSKENQEKKTIATVSLAGCFGCHMSMLDIDTELLDVIELVNFDKSPLTDIKEFSRRCHLGIVEGGCSNTDNLEVLREFRKMCDILVVMGECAVWGGLPSMRNTIPLGECLEEAYLNCITSEHGEEKVPYHPDIPQMLDRVYACNEIVKIDYTIPGCPPSASLIWKVIRNMLWGEEISLLYEEFKYD